MKIFSDDIDPKQRQTLRHLISKHIKPQSITVALFFHRHEKAHVSTCCSSSSIDSLQYFSFAHAFVHICAHIHTRKHISSFTLFSQYITVGRNISLSVVLHAQSLRHVCDSCRVIYYVCVQTSTVCTRPNNLICLLFLAIVLTFACLSVRTYIHVCYFHLLLLP